jgi:arabinose-5-phosphate isomerase
MNKIGQKAIRQEAKGLQALAEKLDKNFDHAVEALSARDLIIFTGIGKSGHVARKLASTFTSMGARAVYMHPTEALHGDLGIITKDCAIVALSRSGVAEELRGLLEQSLQIGCPSILISENDETHLALRVDITLKIPRVAEAWGHAPTTSTVMQMALGDALAVALAKQTGFTEKDFQRSHPGGALGKMKV